VWLLGVWQTGDAGRAVSRRQPEWQAGYREALADFRPADVTGSPFAVRDYTVHRDFGGPEALERLRVRLRRRDVRLMLDFVANHTALDHPWAPEHPEFFVHGGEDDLAREPQNYARVDTRAGARVLAHGRDPYFPGWTDTLQLNYRHAALRRAMTDVLGRIVEQCDGVRCDMAMLLLPDVIARTWGERSRPADGSAAVDEPFWPGAIAEVRRARPDFVFLAEVYWDLERTLQRQGFDYTYDKRLYDRLRAEDAAAIVAHLRADFEFQRRLVRFLENHDEARAAAAFAPATHRAAAVLALLAPGMRLVHEGQLTGRRIHASNHLRRRAAEPIDPELEAFYAGLLAIMRREEVREGRWRLLEREPDASGGTSWRQLVAYSWELGERRLLVAVNWGTARGQGYARLAFSGLADSAWVLTELLPDPTIRVERDGAELARRGLYLDLPGWRPSVLALIRTPS
jgi:glycosidase